ncbi:MAG: hypothetical protein WD342_20945 [Verrucomicrobiales bacterium]
MKMRSRENACLGRAERASALIAILWIVAILSMAVFSATQFLFIELESQSNASSIFRAEQLADMGIALAAHPNVETGDPLLSRTVSDNESFFCRISSEGDRLNLNALLENAEADRIVLEELFFQWGLRRDEAVDAVDNLVDWIDPDDEPTNAGAERSYYLSRDRLNHPFNRPFDSLGEVLLVKGFDRVVAANPAWKDSFTLLSSGELDLNEAPAELVSVVCQCPLETARLFVETRKGFDRVQGTRDDIRFDDVDSALQLLGIPSGFLDEIGARVSVEDPARRLIAIGRHGSIAVERTVTVQYTGETGEILRWTTRRI